jgi:cysteinyl-tRNA synthetase
VTSGFGPDVDAPVVLGGPPGGRTPIGLGADVSLYVCGITPYDAAHVGHAFTYVAFDTLVRFLRARGHTVLYAQNVTDVDDDVLRRAARDDEDYLQLGQRETASFLRDMDTLNIARPTYYPKATEEVAAMVELVGELVAKGNAYEVDGTVFFDVSTFPSFGTLSGLDEAEQVELLAERGGDPDDDRKRNRLDFILWQRSAPGEPSWPSPWGAGRPGWHTECSAMARTHLGTTIDLHGGGADLLYPHHESERAQSEAANGVTFARRWLHTGMVRYQGEKMSKSLGNLVFPRDLVTRHEPAAVRLQLLDHNWHEPWEFTEDELGPAAERLARWRQAAATGPDGLAGVIAEATRTRLELPEQVGKALADDLDTPAALAAVDQLAAAGEWRAVQAAATVLGVELQAR